MIIPPSTIIDATISHDRRTIWVRIGIFGVKFFISDYIIGKQRAVIRKRGINYLVDSSILTGGVILLSNPL
jgi:hypothetical protein